MIHSMTGFARSGASYSWGELSWEIRSVNHRYLDLKLRLPDIFSPLDIPLRHQLKNTLKRGKVDCILKYQPNDNSPYSIKLNKQISGGIHGVLSELQQEIPHATVDLSRLLSWPGLVITETAAVQEMNPQVSKLLEQATEQLLEYRAREGQELVRFLEHQLQKLNDFTMAFEEAGPLMVEKQRAKVSGHLRELATTIDEDRLEQELVYYAQKIDITEEWQRIQAHVRGVQLCLSKGGAQGRHLDFFMQELHREVNTLATKSTDTEIIQKALEAKVIVEQMREQVQNIE